MSQAERETQASIDEALYDELPPIGPVDKADVAALQLKLDGIASRLEKLDKTLNPSFLRQAVRFLRKATFWALTMVVPAVFGYNYMQVKKDDLVDCMDAVQDDMMARGEAMSSAAENLTGCGSKNSCEQATADYRVVAEGMGDSMSLMQSCMTRILPQDLNGVKADATRAVERMTGVDLAE